MSTQKWIAGSTAASFANAFSTEINSLANGNAILSSIAVANGTGGDVYAMLSFLAGATVTTAAPGVLVFGLYPLGQDGTTYGDGRFGSAAGGPFPTNYAVAQLSFAQTTGVTIAGTTFPFLIPPGTFKFILYNQSGATLPSSNTCKYISQNLQIA